MSRACKSCQGYGFWIIGDLCPIGELDSKEWGKRIIKCPWCKAGTITDDEKYRYLKKIFDKGVNNDK